MVDNGGWIDLHVLSVASKFSAATTCRTDRESQPAHMVYAVLAELWNYYHGHTDFTVMLCLVFCNIYNKDEFEYLLVEEFIHITLEQICDLHVNIMKPI